MQTGLKREERPTLRAHGANTLQQNLHALSFYTLKIASPDVHDVMTLQGGEDKIIDSRKGPFRN
jgi:hypothetical protein